MKRFVALALLLTMLGGVLSGCLSKPKVGGDQVAVVNGHVITAEALNSRLKIFELFFRQKMDNPATKQQLVDQLVREQLMLAQTEAFGVTVTDAEVEAEMAKFFGSLDRQYNNSRDEVNQKLQELGLTNEDIAAFLKQFLLTQGVVEKKKAEVTISDAEVQRFYEENKEALYTFQEEVVRAAHVLVPLDQEAKAQEITAKAKAGADFAELAKLYSVDPGSAVLGGDLGYFKREMMVEEFADAAFDLEVDEISEPVRSQYGWHVIKLIDRQPAGTIPFEKAKSDAANKLLPQKQEEAVQEWQTSLEQGAKIEKTTFTEPAK